MSSRVSSLLQGLSNNATPPTSTTQVLYAQSLLRIRFSGRKDVAVTILSVKCTFWESVCIEAEKSTQTLFVQRFWTTLRVMDVRAENRGRLHQKVLFPAAPVVGRNFLTPGHPGVRVRNVRGKSGPKCLCLCCFLPDCNQRAPVHSAR